ncbi:hypothetical protein L1049_011159 [Liquidambar formosana]|uniref:WPP domain-associated protein n=1 Tax=Liquidambar formosana TaxID=63359 RepID=A0AAP0RWG2_LIQFO
MSQYEELKAAYNFPNDFSSTSELFQSVESVVKEDVCMVFLREMVEAWKLEVDACTVESHIKEDIYQFVIAEAVKDAYRLSEAQDRDKFFEDLLSANELFENQAVHGEESLIQKLDSLLKCFEVEKDLMVSASSEIKEHNVHLDLVGLEQEELGEQAIFEEFLTEEESTFSSVSSKLEKALQHLVISKTLLSELGSSLGIAVGDLTKVHDHRTIPITGVVCDKENTFCIPKENEVVEQNTSLSVFLPLRGFPQEFMDFEHMVHEKLGLNMLRLEEVKHQLESLVELADSLRKREKLYRKAFIRRCHNLHKAETEVDFLGDQVDALLGLLEKIYVTLDQHSPVLQQYFGVSDILNLIKKELMVGAAHMPNK